MIHTMIQTEPGLLTVADIQDIQRVAASLPDEPEDPRVQQLWDAWLSERPRRQVRPPSQRATVAPITPRYGAWLPPEARSALKRVLMVEDDLLLVPMKEGGWRSFSEMEIAAERDRFVEIVLSHAPALAGGSGDEERSRQTRIGDERPKLLVVEGIGGHHRARSVPALEGTGDLQRHERPLSPGPAHRPVPRPAPLPRGRQAPRQA
jgi:hypothetical protein